MDKKETPRYFCILYNLYHLPGDIAYFQTGGYLGDCFQFTYKKENATLLTKEEADAIAEHGAEYCRRYEASCFEIRMGIPTETSVSIRRIHYGN